MGQQAKLKRARQNQKQNPDLGDREKWIKVYVEAAGEVLPLHYQPNCCVNATQLAIRVLGSVGVELRAVAVEVYGGNEIFKNLYKTWGRPPLSDEENREWIKRGSWANSTGQGQWNPAHYPHHVVGVTPDFKWLVDSSVGQFCKRDIDSPAIFPTAWIQPIDSTFRDGALKEVDCGPQGILWYEPLDDERYKLSPAWTEDDPEVAGQILQAMKCKRSGTPYYFERKRDLSSSGNDGFYDLIDRPKAVAA